MNRIVAALSTSLDHGEVELVSQRSDIRACIMGFRLLIGGGVVLSTEVEGVAVAGKTRNNNIGSNSSSEKQREKLYMVRVLLGIYSRPRVGGWEKKSW